MESEGGLRQRSNASLDKSDSVDGSSADSSPSLVPPNIAPSSVSTSAPPSRPSFSRSNTLDAYTVDDDLFSGMHLIDLLIIIDAHIELWTRPIRKGAVNWREKADRLVEESRARAKRVKLPRVGGDFVAGLPTPSLTSGSAADLISQRDRERIERVRIKAVESFKRIADKWEEEKTVRLRDKISFFCGVMNVVITSLLIGLGPTWIPAYYSAQILIYFPVRLYTYKKKLYHYFLFDLCYYVNFLCLVYLWILPQSPTLWMACYGLSLGSLGTAIATWRNSLVFHSLDKVISLAIHIFPPLVFTIIRHFYPNAEERYPALKELPHMNPWKSIGINMAIYLVWQALYYQFVIVARKEKIKEGRATSFTYLINDKKRLIGKIAAKVPESRREATFIFGQAVYTFVTLLIPVFVLYDSKLWSSVYLLLLFASSTWSGGCFYLDVFASKFEKELIALRKEFEEQQALVASLSSSPPSGALGASSAAVSRVGSLDKLDLDSVEEASGSNLNRSENNEDESEEARESAKQVFGDEGMGKVEKPNPAI